MTQIDPKKITENSNKRKANEDNTENSIYEMQSEKTNFPNPKYPKTNPRNINVNEIGNPTNIAKSITPTRIKPRIAGSINSAIISLLLAIHLF